MMTATAEPQTATAAPAPTEAWKQQSVGDFFARFNWENLELPVLEAKTPGEAVVLDYSLSVGQFFAAIPWEGGAMLAAWSAQSSLAREQSESALELPNVEGDAATDALPELDEIADDSHLDAGEVTLDDFLGSFSL